MTLILNLLVVFFATKDLDEIINKVESARQLKFREKVTASSYTREQLKSCLEQMFTLSTPERTFREMQKTFEAFRIITKEQDIKAIIHDLLTSQIAGFYDPSTKELRIIANDDSANQADPVTLPHELVHAVTDQYFNLLRYQLANFDDDISSSFTAIIEGDATLFGLKIAYGPQFESVKNWISSQIKMQPVDAKYPEFLYRYFLFPYSDGFEFVLSVFEKHGVEGVNKLYQKPPVSTEQILHPDKYASDFPVQIDISRQLSGELEKMGLKRAASGVMGEIGIQLLLKHHRAPKFITISRGWDGDKYIVFEHKELGTSLLWVTAWDSSKDAKEFHDYIQQLHSGLKGGANYSLIENNVVIVIENFPLAVDGGRINYPAFMQRWLKQFISLREIKEVELFRPILF